MRTRAQARTEAERLAFLASQGSAAPLPNVLLGRETGHLCPSRSVKGGLKQRPDTADNTRGASIRRTINPPLLPPPHARRRADSEALALLSIRGLREREFKQAYCGIDKAFCVVSMQRAAAGRCAALCCADD